MFELSHRSWYKAILSSIVLLQQRFDVHFVSEAWLATKYYWNRPTPLTLLAGSAPDDNGPALSKLSVLLTCRFINKWCVWS